LSRLGTYYLRFCRAREDTVAGLSEQG
jgi:hypothetical protein